VKDSAYTRTSFRTASLTKLFAIMRRSF
jgi:hypothetical protein